MICPTQSAPPIPCPPKARTAVFLGTEPEVGPDAPGAELAHRAAPSDAQLADPPPRAVPEEDASNHLLRLERREREGEVVRAGRLARGGRVGRRVQTAACNGTARIALAVRVVAPPRRLAPEGSEREGFAPFDRRPVLEGQLALCLSPQLKAKLEEHLRENRT